MRGLLLTVAAAILISPGLAQDVSDVPPLTADWRSCIEQNAAAAESLSEPISSTVELLAAQLCSVPAAAYAQDFMRAQQKLTAERTKKLCDRMRGTPKEGQTDDERQAYCDAMTGEDEEGGGSWILYSATSSANFRNPEATALAAQLLTKLRNERLAATPK